jgi:hypothetical protein
LSKKRKKKSPFPWITGEEDSERKKEDRRANMY